jgi:hypothetical protein
VLLLRVSGVTLLESKFEARLNELEQQRWSLPVYRELILADARAIDF